MLIKVGKLLLERSKNITPQERKERQVEVRVMRKNRVITCVLRTGSQQLKALRGLLVEGRVVVDAVVMRNAWGFHFKSDQVN